MNIRVFLLLSLLLLLRMVFTHHYVYIAYWGVLVASTFFLHSRKIYRGKMRSSILLFFLYLLFVTVWRTGEYMVNPALQYGINIAEHFLFTLTVCFMIGLYLGLAEYFRLMNRPWRQITIVLIFNAIGFINEMYQSFAQHGELLQFSADSKKDLLVNFAASFIFLVASVYTPDRS